MSEQRADPRRAVVDQEVAFGDDELFFSRTDPHGVILSGNTVFQRVSSYGWDELTGKPHKIIRHPDMPRAVFWLLWHTILEGDPIGAYVKNRAKDGRYYWVFAIVTPVRDGFLSVRLRPDSQFFAAARQLYAAAVRREKAEQLQPAPSAELLLADLRAAGFDDYKSFMAAALSAELQGRVRRLRREPSEALSLLDAVAEASAGLLRTAAQIEQAHAANFYMPLNLRVRSGHLGAAGAAIGAISANYGDIVADLRDCMARFAASAERVRDSVLNSQFLFGAASVQAEMRDIFRAEQGAEGHQGEDMERLERQRADFEAKAAASLAATLAQLRSFQSDCNDMSRLAAGLEVTRILGKVECATLSDSELLSWLDELGGFQKGLSIGLRELTQANARIADLLQAARQDVTPKMIGKDRQARSAKYS
jgi:aerotaxis receptor